MVRRVGTVLWLSHTRVCTGDGSSILESTDLSSSLTILAPRHAYAELPGPAIALRQFGLYVYWNMTGRGDSHAL